MKQSNGARELGLVVAALAALARFVSGPTLVAVTALVVLVAVAGTGSLLGQLRPWRWPMERVAIPAVAAFAAVGTAHLLDPVPWLGFAFAGSWIVVTWAVGLEVAPALPGVPTVTVVPSFWGTESDTAPEPADERSGATGGGHARPTSARLGAFGLAFLGFAAIGGIVPGSVAGDGQPLTFWVFVATIALDVAIGGVAGYRIAVLRPHTRGEAAVALYQYSMALAPVGVLVRALALPRLFGPALLALAAYVVTSLRESDEPVRFNARLLEETAVLLLAGVVVAVIGLLVR
jgi:hypothetical protein